MELKMIWYPFLRSCHAVLTLALRRCAGHPFDSTTKEGSTFFLYINLYKLKFCNFLCHKTIITKIKTCDDGLSSACL